MSDVQVNWAKTNAALELVNGATGPVVSKYPPSVATAAHPAGVYVTFHLGPPIPRTTNIVGDPGATLPFVDGALHLIWSGPTGGNPTPVNSGGISKIGTGVSHAPVVAPATPAKAEDGDEVEDRIGAAVSKLTPAQQLQVKNARVSPVTKPIATHQGQGSGPVGQLTKPPTVPNARAMHAIKGGEATRKQERDAAAIKALCAASNNAPQGLPASVCTGK